MATVALYDVSARGPWTKPHKLACVRAVRANTPYGGNWFPGAQDFLTPDHAAIRAALPHYWRKAFDRATHNGMASFSHTRDTLHACIDLRDARGRHLTTISCEGYEKDFAPCT